MPKDWNFPSDQLNSLPINSVKIWYFIESILMIVLLFLFISNPDMYLRWPMQVKAVDKTSSCATIDNTVSSANWFIFFCTLLCMKSFILELHLIAIGNISTVIIKRHGNNGHPCLTHPYKVNPSDMCPLFTILLSVLLSIQLIKYFGKLKNVKAFCINDHFIISKTL